MSPEPGQASPNPGLTYAGAGVDLQAREAVVDRIRRVTAGAPSERVLAGVGPFASLFSLAGYGDPVVAASVDSVGTKLRLAIICERYAGVGHDIVNHCVNDVLTSGARPLFFLDYIGSSDLSDGAKLELIEGMVEACREAGCALVGGETADMPDIYAPGDFDLVGFMVGACERPAVLDASSVEAGDVLLALPSNGLHTNGYSLVRRIFAIGTGGDASEDRRRLEATDPDLGETLADALLRPHRSYLHEIEPLLPRLKAMAHITGGGIEGNLARVIPAGRSAVVTKGTWPPLAVFDRIAAVGGIEEDEMYRVFNMGLGMILVAAAGQAESIMRELPEALPVGHVEDGPRPVVLRARE
ncbi:MAG: phosphoribosylformylglycinamidine cyclo-ligase [Dehalococcoidia bacterium]|nr:phosphoribosylformylglycinamidine cyclo-ligase [Dehalococcoidia bacterium]